MGGKEAGEVIEKEIDSYLLIVERQLEEVEVNVALETLSGDCDLYLFECDLKKECEITNNMIDNKNNTKRLKWSDNKGRAKDEV